MWEKGFRTITFAALYDVILWGDNFDMSVIDLTAISESYATELTLGDSEKIQGLIQTFVEQKPQLYARIEQFTSNWDKTYDLIKAIMCTALLELEEVGEDTSVEDKKKIINKYVQIAQDMIGGNNPNLVYAVVGKMFGV